MSDKLTYDIIIVGAGVQGLSTACQLAEQFDGSILVLESEKTFGLGSSGRSGSMLMKSRENEKKIKMSLHAFNFFSEFEANYGCNLGMRRVGFLSLVPGPLRNRFLAEHKIRKSMGVKSEIVESSKISKLAPGVNLDSIEMGVLCREDCEIDATALVRGFYTTAKSLGVDFRFSEPVLEFETTDDKVSGIRTTQSTYSSSYVILAAGPKIDILTNNLGVFLPISNLRRSIYIIKNDDSRFQNGPMVEDALLEWYYRGLGNGRILVGMGKEQDKPPTDGPNLDFWNTVKKVTSLRAPSLVDAELVGGWSGTRPVTPDILPIVGFASGYSNLVLNCGWGGEGIMHSPTGGALVKDIILGTSLAPIDKRSVCASRFETS